MGGIIFTPNLSLNSAEYLSQIYKSGPVQAFVKNGTHYDGNPFPFDGVAWHPYSPQALTSVQSVRDAINVMRASGDASNKIWVTETSVEGRPNLPGVCGVSPGEQYQADYLQEFFTQMVYAFQGDVAAVFWFKYEDFSDSSGYQPWGLVRLEADNQNRYLPGGKVAYYKAAYRVYLSISGPPSPVDRAAPPATINLTNNLYFPETGHHLTGPFLRYWQATGGLALFGFPITEQFEEKNLNDGKIYTVQYFERERFELHPEAKGTAYEVQLGLLGSNLLTINCRSFSRAAPSAEPNNPNRTYIPQTSHYLSGSFKRYWEQNGGLAIFGYPLSEEFGEQNPSDGKFYTVQWFERARFEYHPEAAGTRNEVQLGLLGSQWLKWRGWVR